MRLNLIRSVYIMAIKLVTYMVPLCTNRIVRMLWFCFGANPDSVNVWICFSSKAFPGKYWLPVIIAALPCGVYVCACVCVCVCVFAFVRVCSDRTWCYFYGFGMLGQRQLSFPHSYSASDGHCFTSSILNRFQAGREGKETSEPGLCPFKALPWRFPIVTSAYIWLAKTVSQGFLISKGGEVRKCSV